MKNWVCEGWSKRERVAMHLPWSLGILSEDSASGTSTGKEKTRERSQGLKEREAECHVSHSRSSRLARALPSNRQHLHGKSTVKKSSQDFLYSPSPWSAALHPHCSPRHPPPSRPGLRACWVTLAPVLPPRRQAGGSPLLASWRDTRHLES